MLNERLLAWREPDLLKLRNASEGKFSWIARSPLAGRPEFTWVACFDVLAGPVEVADRREPGALHCVVGPLCVEWIGLSRRMHEYKRVDSG